MESHIHLRQGNGTNAPQEQLIIVIVPYMRGVKLCKTVSVAMYCVHIENRHVHGVQYFQVYTYIRRITIHGSHLILCTEIVTLETSSVSSPHRVATNMDRSMMSVSLGHLNANDRFAFDLMCRNHAFCQYVQRHFLLVVEDVP